MARKGKVPIDRSGAQKEMQEVGAGGTLVIEQEKIDQLNKIADSLAAPGKDTFHSNNRPPFDVSRPNLHANKADFAVEFAMVSSALRHVGSLLHLFRAEEIEVNTEGTVRLAKVVDALNLAVRNGTRKRKIREGRSRDLIVQNFRDTGFVENFAEVLLDMELGLRARLTELKDQEALFWGAGHRPKNPHAYAVALRFARLYHELTGKIPTVGTSSVDGKPSTRFGNDLADVFRILEIDASVKGPAKQAVKEVKAEAEKKRPEPFAFPPLGLPEKDLLRIRANNLNFIKPGD